MEERTEVKHEDVYTLVDKIKEGDREAFMTLTRLYQKKVFLLAYSFFRNREDALDIVQETFLRFYEKVRMFQRGKNFQNWLLQIAKNLCGATAHKNNKKGRGKRYWGNFYDFLYPGSYHLYGNFNLRASHNEGGYRGKKLEGCGGRAFFFKTFSAHDGKDFGNRRCGLNSIFYLDFVWNRCFRL